MTEEAGPGAAKADAPDLSADVIGVGIGRGRAGARRVVLELVLANAGAPSRVGGWSVQVRLPDGTTRELPLGRLPAPATFVFPDGSERRVEPASLLPGRLRDRPIGRDEERPGFVVCGSRGLEPDDLTANGTVYTASFRDGDGGDVEARHLVSQGPIGDAPEYFPGLEGT